MLGVIVMYAPAIQEAVRSGDLGKMKQIQKQAEEHVREYGNVPAALEALKLEIAKLEGRLGKKGS